MILVLESPNKKIKTLSRNLTYYLWSRRRACKLYNALYQKLLLIAEDRNFCIKRSRNKEIISKSFACSIFSKLLLSTVILVLRKSPHCFMYVKFLYDHLFLPHYTLATMAQTTRCFLFTYFSYIVCDLVVSYPEDLCMCVK